MSPKAVRVRVRDGRRAHDEDVEAAVALGRQGQALVDAEAVLLVDDGEGDVAPFDLPLEQGMSADKNVDLARSQTLENAAASGAGVAPGQHGEAKAGRLAQGGQALAVLAGEKFCRRHQAGLTPCSTAIAMAKSATMALPAPTSPWSSRSTCRGAAMSPAISAIAVSCPPVRRQQAARSFSCTAPVPTTGLPRWRRSRARTRPRAS